MTEYNRILPRLLAAVPELREGYNELLRQSRNGRMHWTVQDHEDIAQLSRLHGLDETRQDEVGLTIVFDNLLLPFLINLVTNASQSTRLAEIMAWIEELASSLDFQVRNLVNVTICEGLLTTHSSHFVQLFPYMGKSTRELRKKLLSEYNVDAKIKALLSTQP